MHQNTPIPGKSGSVTTGLRGWEPVSALLLPAAKTSTQKIAEA